MDNDNDNNSPYFTISFVPSSTFCEIACVFYTFTLELCMSVFMDNKSVDSNIRS